MGTSIQDISRWFDRGVKDKKTHMIVVCDTFDWEDYPLYANSDTDCIDKYNSHNGSNMQRVMEIYDLRKPKASQLNGHGRVFNLPKQ